MNAHQITTKLARWCLGLKHTMVCPNAYLSFYGWESDMVSVTKAGLLHEYEVKISRSDFFADFKKARRTMKYPPKTDPLWYRKGEVVTVSRHDLIQSGPNEKRPNYFWFVVPKDLVTLDEVPPYAGLIYVSECSYEWADYLNLSVVRDAPRLHRVKREDLMVELGQKMMYRYWNARFGDKQFDLAL